MGNMVSRVLILKIFLLNIRKAELTEKGIFSPLETDFTHLSHHPWRQCGGRKLDILTQGGEIRIKNLKKNLKNHKAKKKNPSENTLPSNLALMWADMDWGRRVKHNNMQEKTTGVCLFVLRIYKQASQRTGRRESCPLDTVCCSAAPDKPRGMATQMGPGPGAWQDHSLSVRGTQAWTGPQLRRSDAGLRCHREQCWGWKTQARVSVLCRVQMTLSSPVLCPSPRSRPEQKHAE